MKKSNLLILIIVLVLILALGCTPKNESPEPAPGPPPSSEPSPGQGEEGGMTYKDGTYTAKGETDDKGWTPEVTITVENGKIKDAKYNEYSAETKTFKTEDEEYKENFMNINKVDVVAAYDKFGKELVEKQDPSKVDATGGATSSGQKFIELANKALKDAK